MRYFLIIIFSIAIGLSSCKQEKVAKKEVSTKKETKEEILYWTCGMHPSVKVSPEEYKKGITICPICKMDLIPVYAEGIPSEEAGKEEVERMLKLSETDILLAGVKTEEVTYRNLEKEIYTVGKVAYDPELVIAQEEYLATLSTLDKVSKSSFPDVIERTRRLLEQSIFRLKLLGMSKEQITELKESRKVQTNLIIPEKSNWVYAYVYEYELAQVKIGQKVRVSSEIFPNESYAGKIVAIDPIVDPNTRSVRIRANIRNPNLKLKPEMLVNVTIEIPSANVLSIPKDAVLDIGTQKIVWVAKGEGKYVKRDVQVGAEAIFFTNGEKHRYVPVFSGLQKGESVVTRANFLIDSQSQLTGPAAVAYGGAIGLEIEEKPVEEVQEPTKETKKRVIWRCPMVEHQDVVYNKPGDCPRCNMKLERAVLEQ